MTADDEDQPQDDEALTLVLPFVTVQSQGGPHDDDAYAAGWEMAGLDRILCAIDAWQIMSRCTLRVTTRTVNLPQLDLVAMRYSFNVKAYPTQVEGWSDAVISRGADPTDLEEPA